MFPGAPGAKTKYVPHKVLRDGVVYISLAGSDSVLMVRTVISKVNMLVNENGHEVMGPDGNPLFNIQVTPVATFLTKEEWNARKQMEDLE